MKRFKKQKREKFAWILTKSLAVALALSCVFAVGFQTYMRETINKQLEMQIESESADLMELISQRTQYAEPHLLMNDISSVLSMYTCYNVTLEHPPMFDPSSMHMVQIVPNYSEKCHDISVLVDKDGNIVASSRMNFQVLLLFEKDKDKDKYRGFYSCDIETLSGKGIEELISGFRSAEANVYTELCADSMYINKKDRTFIPHEGQLRITTYKKSGIFDDDSTFLLTTDEIEKEETKEFTIDINDLDVDSSDYELMTVHHGISNKIENPRYSLLGFFGTDRDAFDSYADEFSYRYESGSSYSYRGNSDGTATFARNYNVTLNGEHYMFSIRYIFNYMEPHLVRYFWTYTLLVAAILVLIAVLYAWRRNVSNKVKYAMEDFQRDLTNALAHDIKTPLTAIGGYAENILEGGLSGDEEQKYLRSIIDNVSATDSMVSRTLQLNTMDGSKLGREKVSVGELVESAVKKYDIALEEKNITFKTSGSAKVKTNRASLDTIVENLISNAVKYTSENGNISAELSNKRLVITNTVAAKVDVKKLKQPFVRGDSSRSNVQGSGLGLSLADRAAHMNGMELKLACSDTEFMAELKF